MQKTHPAVDVLRMKYADAIQEQVSHLEVAGPTRIPHPYPENGAKMFIEMSEEEMKQGKSYHHVILNQKSLVGMCGLMNIIPRDSAELGYWIGKPYWGMGFASFGVKMTLAVAFNHFQLRMVYATPLEFNKASMRVLEKNGFIFTRKEPHHNAKWSVDTQLMVHEITREEWEAHKRDFT